jgi:hemerythrin-like domain-containing protein
MQAILRSSHRDHRNIEEVLRVLEQECDRFRSSERPDYDLLSEILDYLDRFLYEYHQRREDTLLARLTNIRNATCLKVMEAVAAEQAATAAGLQELGETLRDILNEQRVLRDDFNDAALRFIFHERRQIKIEEEQLFPLASSVLTPEDWADIYTRSSAQRISPSFRQLEKHLRDQRRWIVRQELAAKAERDNAVFRSNAD